MEEQNKDIQKEISKVENEGSEESAELGKIIQERDEYLNGWKRAKADLINYKKDEMARLQEMSRFATEDMIRDLIVVVSSFDIGISALEREEGSKVDKGIYMIRTQLLDILKKRGLEPIKVRIGEDFNPEIHEAVSIIESDMASGSVVEEVERGYYLHGRLLRPSIVKVAE